MVKFFKSTKILFLLGIILCIPVVLPYFHSGYFPTHDGEWAVVRAGEMFRELRDHQFPPRYSGVLNFGYGYPLFNFTYPFPYYLATILHFLKLGFIDGIKTIFALTVLTSFTGMFLLSKKQYGSSIAAFFTGILYIYLPYRMVDLYVRGSIGESVAFSLYPFLLLVSIAILKSKKQGIAFFSAPLLVASLVTAHNISAVYFGFIFLALFVHALINKNKNALFLLGAFVWGGLISSFFFLPALFEKNNILLSVIPIAQRSLYYVPLPRLLMSAWGYGTPTDANPFTYQIGFAQIFGFFLSVIILLKNKAFKNVEFTFSLLVFIFLFMLFPASNFVWKLPLLSEINYPWTLLLPLGFLMSFLAGFFVKHVRYGVYILGALALLSVSLTFNYTKPEKYTYNPDSYYLTNEAPTTSSQELMPLWVKKFPSSRFEKKVQVQGNVEGLTYSSNRISFTINSQKSQTATVNQIYYPGWKASINGKEVPVGYNNEKGAMQVSLDVGQNLVLLTFAETPLRFIADVVSVISFVILLAFILKFAYSFSYGKKRTKK